MKLNRTRLWDGMMVLVVIVAVVVGVKFFIKARADACRPACMNKLRIIEAAKEQAMFDKKLSPDADCDDPTNKAVVNQYIKGNTTPICPDGGTFRYGIATNLPICSFFNPKDGKTYLHTLGFSAATIP